MENNQKNLLITLADKNYLDFAKQLFSSVYFNAGWQGDYMLLAHEVPESDLEWFKNKGILIKRCQKLTDHIAGRWPVTILSKFYIFTPEFKKWDKIIYLDADLIVNYSLDNLLDIEGLAAIKNRSFTFFGSIKLKHFYKFFKLNHKSQQDDLKKYGPNLPMLCATLLVINPKIITNETFANLKSLFLRYQNSSSNTEEFFFSIYFANQWTSLSPIYCLFYNYFKDHQINSKNLKSITTHFVSYQKPLDYCDSIYEIWKNNFNRADQIDLNNRLPAKGAWNNWEVKKNYYRVIRQIVLAWPRLLINYLIGLGGLVLKKLSPSVYQFLLKFKKSILKLPLLFKDQGVKNNKPVDKLPYTIRLYQTGDENQLVDIINRIFTKMDNKKWFWKYKKGPLKPLILVAENNRKEIVGQFAVLPNQMKYYSDQKIGHQTVEVVIEKEYRNQKFLESCISFFIQQGDFLPYGFVDEKMANIYSRAMFMAGVKQTNKTIKSNILEKKLDQSWWPKMFNLNKKINQNKLSIERLDDNVGEKEINSLWEKKQGEIKVGIIRDWKFLKWRIIDTPEKNSLFLLKDEDEIIGYFSLEIDKTTAIISDLLILNKNVDLLLFSAIENFCRQLKLKKIKLFTTDKTILKILKERGYYKDREIYFTYNDSPAPIEINDFYLTLIDAD